MADIATEPKTLHRNALISLLYVARGLRGFGDGFAIIILPAYMTALGYDAVAVGIVATASLLGTALLTLIVGWIAPRHDLRALLIVRRRPDGGTGLAFPGVEHFVLIVLVAFIGTINPSGGDLGVLVPLEHAVLAQQRDRRAPHPGVRALQPDRRALHRRRLAGGIVAGSAGRRRQHQARAFP